MEVVDYILYFKKCPGVDDPRHFKVGIAQLHTARSRLATYQNAVGPVWTESFMRVWIGDSNQIRLAEKAFKRFFKENILSAEAGLSEWICDVTLEQLLDYITEIREDHFIKFIDVPEQFLPLTMPLCEDLAAWYDNNRPEEDDS